MTTTYQTERTYPTKRALEDALLPYTRRWLAVQQEDGGYRLNEQMTSIVQNDMTKHNPGAYVLSLGDVTVCLRVRQRDTGGATQYTLEAVVTHLVRFYPRQTLSSALPCTLEIQDGDLVLIRPYSQVSTYTPQEHTP